MRILYPTSRCEGVRGSSTSYEETYVSGRELSTASISVMSVRSSSYDRQFFPTDFLKHLLADLIIRSKSLPCQGAFSKLNCHSIQSCEKYLASGLSNTRLISLDADLNVLPLSEMTRDGAPPRLPTKRLKLRMKVSAVMFLTRSRCTAHVAQ